MMNTGEHLQELADVVAAFTQQVDQVEAAGNRLLACLQGGGKVLTCGNGGSATDALHLAEELTGRYRDNRRPLAALCLNADPAALTCIANDFGFEQVFARQVEALGRAGDCLVGFSTSGNSANVNTAFQAARSLGIHTILLGGKDGGAARALVDTALIVPSANGARIQELHTFILHAWLEIIDGYYAASHKDAKEPSHKE